MLQKLPKDSLCHWYVIHTKVNQESRADANLRAWKIETFAPLIKLRRVNQYSRKVYYKSGPLFPRYIFARFNSDAVLAKIRFTRGIHKVVSCGGVPLSMDDEIIALLKSRIDDDQFVKLEEKLKRGDKIRINGGPLEGLLGVFEASAGQATRVRILLTTVHYQARIEVDRTFVQQN